MSKREGGNQMRRGEEDGDPEAEFVKEPQFLSKDELGERRIVRARRPPPSAAIAAPSAAAAEAAPSRPSDERTPQEPLAPPPAAQSANVFASPAAAVQSPKRAELFSAALGAAAAPPPVALPTAFSFGTSFGASGFAAPAAPAAPAAVPASAFSFGPTPAAAPAAPSFTTFGGGAFSFGDQVNAFVAAREQKPLEAQAPAAAGGFGGFGGFGAVRSADDVGAQMTPADDGDDDPEREVAPAEPTGRPAFGGEAAAATGEEGDTVELETSAKLVQFVPGQGGAPGEWAERGVGPLRVSLHRDSTTGAVEFARLVMREERVRRVLLNERIGPALRVVARKEKYFTICVPRDGGAVATFAVRIQGAKAAEDTATVLSLIDQYAGKK